MSKTCCLRMALLILIGISLAPIATGQPLSISKWAGGSCSSAARVAVGYFCDLHVSGGVLPYTWSLVSGADLLLVSSGSTTTVKVSSPAQGSQNFTVKVVDGSSTSITASFSYTAYTAPSITTSSPLPGGIVGVPYNTTLSPSGGFPPYVFSFASGLPPGVFFGSSGLLTGTPTTAGTYTFNVTLDDDGGFYDDLPQARTTKSFSITIATPVTIQTSPSGLQFSVDGGAAQTAPQTLSLSQGSHTIAVTTTQPGGIGTQYVFTGWSDGGAASHPITVGSSAATYTASFKTQYQLTISAVPAAGGTVTPASGSYYDSGTSVPISATVNSGYSFTAWGGNVSSPANPSTSVVMSQPQTVTANFTQPPVSVTIQTIPGPLLFVLDGVPQTAPKTLLLSQGSHTIIAPSPQAYLPTVQLVFTGWSDGGAATHSFNVGTTPFTLTASFKFQDQLTISASPGAGGTVTPGSGYFDDGSVVGINATPNSGFSFTGWSGNVANAINPSTTVTMNGPQTVTANFAPIPSGPTIISLTPSSVTAGGPGFTLTVNGTGFDTTYATVMWNGSPLPRTFVSPNQVMATVAASLITAAGTVNITVNNQASTSAPATFTITGGLAITAPSSLSSAVVGAAYGPVTFTASGGTGGYTWSATGLPNGLTMSPSGVLSGTPTGTQGPYNPQFTVKDSSNATTSVALSLTILPPRLNITAPTSLSSGVVGTAYGPVTFTVTGGTGGYIWTAAGLPAGMGINLATGLLSGTPATGTQGPYTPQFTVKDSSNTTATVTLPLTILPPGLNITSPNSLSSGTVGVAYPTVTFTAAGGAGGYTWSATGLPNGLTISPAGVLNGTPSPVSQGSYTPHFTVKDSSEVTATVTIPMTVSPPQLKITCDAPSTSAAGTAYSATCTAAGGTPAYNWTYSGLPSGISGSNSGITVTIAGTVPNPPPSSYTVTVTVTDSTSPTKQTKSQTIAITINGNTSSTLTIGCSASSAATAGTVYSGNCSASGGTPPYDWTYSGLPSWLSAGTSGSTVALSGTPPTPPPASYSLTVTVSDSATLTKQTTSQTITITVSSAAVQGVTITQNNSGTAPNQTNLLVQFGQPASVSYTGTLSLSFKADTAVTNVPPNYVDPAAGFPVSGQSTTSLTQNFSVSQSQTQATVQFGQGTVAGVWTAALTALSPGGVPSPVPSSNVPIALAAPVITAGSVKIVFNSTNTGFTVQLSGYATSRDLSSATFTFAPAGNGQLTGTTVTVPFNGQDQTQWFNTNAGRNAGGTFSLSVPFTYSGDPNALGSVAVTLTNSKGTSPVLTGSR